MDQSCWWMHNQHCICSVPNDDKKNKKKWYSCKSWIMYREKENNKSKITCLEINWQVNKIISSSTVLIDRSQKHLWSVPACASAYQYKNMKDDFWNLETRGNWEAQLINGSRTFLCCNAYVWLHTQNNTKFTSRYGMTKQFATYANFTLMDWTRRPHKTTKPTWNRPNNTRISNWNFPSGCFKCSQITWDDKY